MPEYIVGIDLGTTNTTVSYLRFSDLNNDDAQISTFKILQQVEKDALEERDILPSYLYNLFHEKNILPWDTDIPYVVGEYAFQRGSELPGRLISSAKSWLCHSRVDRRAPILPINAAEGVVKISPLRAQAEILHHVKNAWNYKFKDVKLQNQLVVITIPASFDAVARELTLEAAKYAGLENVLLLEEPQAAFYAWINQRNFPWRKQIKVGDVVLVIDIGGGTTDFSLIQISEEKGEVALKRLAVGDHILLGGDNMDLTLAFYIKSKLEISKKKIDSWQAVALSYVCRKAKESLLSDFSKKSESIILTGKGSSLISGTIKTSLEKEEIEKILIDGFFPKCNIDDYPVENEQIGIKELNLPYATDPAITKHLAHFLSCCIKNHKTYPTAVLFNGGVLSAKPFRDRLVEVINEWLENASQPPIKVLEGFDLVHSVSCGAVRFAMAKNGKGIRIRGGLSQNYYIGIESSMPAVPGIKPPIKALCIAKAGIEEGSSYSIPNHTFGLVVGKKVQFKFFKSASRRDDEVGHIIQEIPSDVIETTSLTSELLPPPNIESGTLVDVNLNINITEIGTLEIWCQQPNSSNRWKLEFNIREAIK